MTVQPVATHSGVDPNAAILTGLLYIPRHIVGGEQAVTALAQTLTHINKGYRGNPDTFVPLYDLHYRNYIGVPRAWGMEKFKGIQIIDRTVYGDPITVPKRPDPNHPRVRNPVQQAKFMRDLHHGIVTYGTFIASAPTGTGKTVCFLDAAAEYGRRTLILVHLTRLMDQWVDEIHDKLGVPRERIGILQSGRSEWREKDFVVGMLHSAVQREYDPSVYRAFGLIGFDELHKLGTEFFAPAMKLFPAQKKVGLTATVVRKDGGDKIYYWHLGPVRVVSEAEAMPCQIHVVRHRNSNMWGDNAITRIGCLTKLPHRNRKLARIISQFHREGRQALIVSASIEHLQALMKIAHEQFSVPYRAMGQYFGEVHLGTKTITDRYGQKVKKKVRKKRTAEELAIVKERAQIIFATYGMITEGIDIPRLDAGLDATPMGKATQLIGRIRRPFENKLPPKWVTMFDENCVFSQKMFAARMRDYSSSGCEVIDYGGDKRGR